MSPKVKLYDNILQSSTNPREIFSVNYLWTFLHSCQNTPSLHVCRSVLLVFEEIFQPILNSIRNPKKQLPKGDRYSMSAVFPRVSLMCTVSFGDWSEWSWRTRPREHPRLCWYSCLPWGSTTAPEERDQINDLRPWHLVSSLFTFHQTEEVVALTAELSWVQSQSCWLYPTGLYSLNDTDYLSGACLIWCRPWTFSWNWPNMTKSDHIGHEEDHLRY